VQIFLRFGQVFLTPFLLAARQCGSQAFFLSFVAFRSAFADLSLSPFFGEALSSF